MAYLPGDNSWLINGNDTFGIDYADEWDDGTTASFFTGLKSNLYFGGMDLYGFTYRGDEDSDASRLDQLNLYGGYEYRVNGRLTLLPGAGLNLFGDFGGYDIQVLIHESMGVDREIPDETTYYSDLNYADPYLALSGYYEETLLSLPFLLLTKAQYSPVRGQIGLYTELSSTLKSENSLVYFGVGYAAAFFEEDSELLSYVLENEEGVWIDLDFHVGGMYVNKSINLTTGTPSGGIGFMLIQPEGEKEINLHSPHKLSAVSNIGYQSWDLAFLIQPNYRRIPPGLKERSYLLMSLKSGWYPEEEDNDLYRFSSLSGGGRLYLLPQTDGFQINPHLSLIAGWQQVRQYENTSYVNSADSRDNRLHTDLTMGVDFNLPSQGSNYGLTLLYTAETYPTDLSEGVKNYFGIGITASGG